MSKKDGKVHWIPHSCVFEIPLVYLLHPLALNLSHHLHVIHILNLSAVTPDTYYFLAFFYLF